MTTMFGRNMRLSVDAARRGALHAVLTEGLGCKSMSPADDLAVYVFDDGFNLGVYFVAAADTLSDSDHLKAPWLELTVDDLPSRKRALKQLDVRVVPYERDLEHAYYQLPGGPVFRLAERAQPSRVAT